MEKIIDMESTAWQTLAVGAPPRFCVDFAPDHDVHMIFHSSASGGTHAVLIHNPRNASRSLADRIRAKLQELLAQIRKHAVTRQIGRAAPLVRPAPAPSLPSHPCPAAASWWPCASAQRWDYYADAAPLEYG